MKLICFLLLACLSLNAISQTPQGISYQGVLRNLDGSIISDANITITFRIHDSSPDGAVVYEENHSTTTNSNGLVNLTVGMGTAVNGVFSQIAWGLGSKYLQVLMNNGSGEVDLGTQQMMSVPYALLSNASSSSLDGVKNFSVVGDTLFLNDGNYLIIPNLSISNVYNTNMADPRPLYSAGAGVTDVEGEFYPSIIIDGQEWMQKNLSVSSYRNGLPIPTSISPYNTDASIPYMNNSDLEQVYGRLYNYSAVTSANQLCPTGWHVPSHTEWNQLIANLGGDSIAGRFLKQTTSWNSPNNASNISGFSALPGGAGNLYVNGGTPDNNFNGLGFNGNWWTSSTYDNIGYVWSISMSSDSPSVNIGNLSGGMGLSIRCIKD